MIFIAFSVLGYVAECIFAWFYQKRFVNRGFLFGPWCPIYGFVMVFVIIISKLVEGNVLLLFLFSCLFASLMEYWTGYLLEKIFGAKWWDYSSQKMNMNGYICLKFSLLWGLCGTLSAKLIYPGICYIQHLIPPGLLGWVLLGIVFVIFADFVLTVITVFQMKKTVKRLGILNQQMNEEEYQSKRRAEIETKKSKIENHIRRYRRLYFKLLSSFPGFRLKSDESTLDELKSKVLHYEQKSRELIAKQRERNSEAYEPHIPKGEPAPFACGICFTKLFWVFTIGCVVGVIIETIYVLAVTKHLEMRVGLVLGPFNPVYGFGAVIITLCLYKFYKTRDIWIFVASMILGGAFEYTCSLFQELAFGTVSWEYSQTPLNIGGRTNLLYSFFWGILGLVWIKEIYPRLSRLIEKIRPKPGKIITVVLCIFLSLDMLLSVAAVYRRTERNKGIPARGAAEAFLDHYFNDEVLEFIYPSMQFTEEE